MNFKKYKTKPTGKMQDLKNQIYPASLGLNSSTTQIVYL
jgi:hypothetical protein